MIELVDIQKSFGPKQVLSGLSMHCPPGRTTVVIGPSGCGKSTTLRLILRLIEPDRGRVMVDGQAINELDPEAVDRFRRRVGMVFQSAALFDSLKVWENVAFALLEQDKVDASDAKKVAEEKLEIVGLKGSADLYPKELSGGMQKRVGFARAIARNPDFLLFDEPTTGLDPITSTVIEDLITDLSKQMGATSVVVTHQLSTIFRTADQIVMLKDGCRVFEGTPEEIRQVTNPVVKNFIEGRKEIPT